jgi:hypothetical protein
MAPSTFGMANNTRRVQSRVGQHLRSRRNDGSGRDIQATTVTERAAISTWGIPPEVPYGNGRWATSNERRHVRRDARARRRPEHADVAGRGEQLPLHRHADTLLGQFTHDEIAHGLTAMDALDPSRPLEPATVGLLAFGP